MEDEESRRVIEQDRIRLMTAFIAIVLGVALIAYMIYSVVNIEAIKNDPKEYLQLKTHRVWVMTDIPYPTLTVKTDITTDP